MGTRRVEEFSIFTHDPSEMGFIDDQQLVQAFRPRGSHPPFHEGIGVWRANRRRDHIDPCGAKNPIESGCELLIVVTDQKPDVGLTVDQLPHNLSGLLGDPCAFWVCGTIDEMNAPTADLNEHQHLDCLQKQRLHGEKVACQEVILVVRHQLTPTR